MSDSFDLIILGGGCAGLSLGTRLAHLGSSSPSTLILEGRTAYSHDRTWCFFKDDQEPSPCEVQHAWPFMNVESNANSAHLNCGAAPYQMVHAGQFYKTAQQTIRESELVHLRLDAAITTSPEKIGGIWKLETSSGVVQARYVIDTRPAQQPKRDGAKLWQSFYGQEIECAVDVFDPTCGDLMDFSAAKACGAQIVFPDAVSFVYVLPTAKNRALLEFTVFGPDPLSPESLADLFAKAVVQRLGGASYSVLRSEHGVLPMGTIAPATSCDSSYVFAGLTAGGARPSSGYAFARIQRWSAACADSLANGRGPVGHAPDGLLLRTMDALFLKLVRAYPQAAPDLFLALFAGTDTQSVIRFLSDRASLTDYARVVASLIPGPLLRALLGSIRQRRGVMPLLKAL